MFSLSAEFLGSGNNQAQELGNSSVVILQGEQPWLCIDFGFTTFERYFKRFNQHPEAIYITHCHLDHIGGLEQLFYNVAFSKTETSAIKIFCHPRLIPILHERLGNYPGQVAEGNINFWDCFQLIPATNSFWLNNCLFKVFATRHHEPNSSFGIQLPGHFLFTGDTRPIPEVICHLAAQGEVIFHDASIIGNPSHTGLSEIFSEYSEEQLKRFIIYHLDSLAAVNEAKKHGVKVAVPGLRVHFSNSEEIKNGKTTDQVYSIRERQFDIN